MKELEQAEDFLKYFKVCHDPKAVKKIRMLVLAQFRIYKEAIDVYNADASDEVLYGKYAGALSRAYKELTTDPEALQALRDRRRENMPESSCDGCSPEMMEGCGSVEVPPGL